MKRNDIIRAKIEATRFLDRISDFENLDEYNKDKDKNWINGSKFTAAMKRASMDLSRALATLRK